MVSRGGLINGVLGLGLANKVVPFQELEEAGAGICAKASFHIAWGKSANLTGQRVHSPQRVDCARGSLDEGLASEYQRIGKKVSYTWQTPCCPTQ